MPLPKVITSYPHFIPLDPDQQQETLDKVIEQLPEGYAFFRAPSQEEQQRQENENFIVMVERQGNAIVKFEVPFVVEEEKIKFTTKKGSYDSLDAIVDLFVRQQKASFIVNCVKGSGVKDVRAIAFDNKTLVDVDMALNGVLLMDSKLQKRVFGRNDMLISGRKYNLKPIGNGFYFVCSVSGEVEQYLFISSLHVQRIVHRDDVVHFHPSQLSPPTFLGQKSKSLEIDKDTLDSPYFFPMNSSSHRRGDVLAALKKNLPEGSAFFCFSGNRAIEQKIMLNYKKAGVICECDVNMKTENSHTTFFVKSATKGTLSFSELDEFKQECVRRFGISFIVNCIRYERFKNLNDFEFIESKVIAAQKIINDYLADDVEVQKEVFGMQNAVLQENCQYTLVSLGKGFYLLTSASSHLVVSNQQIHKILALQVDARSKRKRDDMIASPVVGLGDVPDAKRPKLTSESVSNPPPNHPPLVLHLSITPEESQQLNASNGSQRVASDSPILAPPPGDADCPQRQEKSDSLSFLGQQLMPTPTPTPRLTPT